MGPELIFAGAMALIGGIANMSSADYEANKAYTKASHDLEWLETEYELKKKQAKEQFEKAKEEAERNATKSEKEADIVDLGADITETASSNDFNAAIDSLYLSQAGDTWNWNTAAMQAGSSTGAAYANLASSGVRAGGSMSDAILMESSLNSAQLQFSQDAKRRQDNNNLGSVLNQLAGNRYGIYQNRYGADATRDDAMYLRNSYLEGGRNYNLYQNQLETLNYDFRRSRREIEEVKNANTGWNKFVNVATSFFGGASKGAQTGYNLGTAFHNITNDYKTKVGDKDNG